MSFRDDVRRSRQAVAAQPEGLSRRERRKLARESLAAEDRAAFSEWLPPDADAPHFEILKTGFQGTAPAPGDLTGWTPTVIEAYLGIVGIRPEDSYGIWPGSVDSNGSIPSVVIAYRDRPEYTARRQRFFDWQGQNR